MNNKNIISPRGRDFFLYRKKKRYAELTGISNCKNGRIKNLLDNKLIGRFSCLSVSKLANITSFYNGKAYYYVMNMDIDQLHIDKIYELDTTEHNGVEVKIPISNFNADSLDCLSFFDNVYVECDGDLGNSGKISEFNKRKIHDFKNFKIVTYDYRRTNDKTEILLGKVPYEIDFDSLWDYNDDWYRSWKPTFKVVYPCINIGEVDITPNRESLIYSERTKERLRSAYQACISEITEYWNVKCTEEYEDFYKWAKELTKWRVNRLDLDGVNVEVSNKLVFDVKFKKHPEWGKINAQERRELTKSLFYTKIDTLGIFHSDGTYYRGKHDLSIKINDLINDWVFDSYHENRIVLVVPSMKGFSGKYFKSYIMFKYPSKNIMFLHSRRVNAREMRAVVSKIWGATTLTSSNLSFVVGLLKECFRTIKNNTIYSDITGSEEYQQYKKEHQDPRSYTAKHSGNIMFTIFGNCIYNMEKVTTTLDKIVPHIREHYSKEGNIVYSQLDNPFLSAFTKIRYPNLIIIGAAKNNMKYLEEGLPSWIRPIEELYHPDNKVLIKYKTAYWIESQEGVAFNRYKVIPEYFRIKMQRIHKYLGTYDIGSLENDDAKSLLSVIPEDKFDLDILGDYKEVLPYAKLAYKISSSYWLRRSNAETDFYILMKAKCLRPDFEYYETMRRYVNEILKAV